MFRALRVRESAGGTFSRAVENLNFDDLPQGEVTIRVLYSSLNYKDALSASGNRGVTRLYPHTPGCDAAGIVAASEDPGWQEGQKVIVTGYDLGMNTHGGFSEFIRVPSKWVVKLPDGLSLKQSMIIGTAGFTAGLGIRVIQRFSAISPGAEVLVTGASGGVGSFACAILAHLGFRVTACSSKASSHEFLESLGVSRILSRSEFLGDHSRALEKGIYSAMIDTVGGDSLCRGAAQCLPYSVAACCGMITSPVLKTSLIPFLLRGIRLVGLSAAQTPMEIRQRIWEDLAGIWNFPALDPMGREIPLDSLEKEIQRTLTGKQVGRVLIRVGEGMDG